MVVVVVIVMVVMVVMVLMMVMVVMMVVSTPMPRELRSCDGGGGENINTGVLAVAVLVWCKPGWLPRLPRGN